MNEDLNRPVTVQDVMQAFRVFTRAPLPPPAHWNPAVDTDSDAAALTQETRAAAALWARTLDDVEALDLFAAVREIIRDPSSRYWPTVGQVRDLAVRFRAERLEQQRVAQRLAEGRPAFEAFRARLLGTDAGSGTVVPLRRQGGTDGGNR